MLLYFFPPKCPIRLLKRNLLFLNPILITYNYLLLILLTYTYLLLLLNINTY